MMRNITLKASALLLIVTAGCVRQNLPIAGDEKIRILTIGFDSALRDSVELAKESDFDVSTVSVGGSIRDPQGTQMAQTTFYWLDFHRSEETVVNDLKRALSQKPDVIIMTNRPAWEKYPAEVRSMIVEQVKNGASLFTFGASAEFKKLVSANGSPERLVLPFDPVPGRDNFRFDIWKFGQGRVVMQPSYLDYRCGYFSPMLEERGTQDYWLARFAELIRRTRKDYAPAVTSRTKLYNENGVVIEQDSKLSSGTYYAVTEHFDTDGNPAGRSGKSFVRSNQYGIAKLNFASEDILSPGMKFKLNVQWKEKSSDGETVLVLRDLYGRSYFRKIMAGTPETVEAVLPEGSLSVVNYAELEFRKSGEATEFARVEFTVPENRTKADFYFLAWNGAVGTSVRHQDYFRILRENGIDGLTNMNPSLKSIRAEAMGNFTMVPYTGAFHARTIPSLFDKTVTEKAKKRAAEAAEYGRRYGALAHSLGDENYMTPFKNEGRFWDNPVLWQAFRSYLQEMYGTLENLNKSWKKSFSAWNEIRFASEEEMFSAQAPAAWVDYRTFISKIFIGRQKELRDIVGKINPGTFIGWEGGEQFSSYDGYDLYEYSSGFDMSNVYSRSFSAVKLPNKIFNGHAVRSFAPAGALTGLWLNGADYPNELQLTPWLALFSGMKSIWWWHSTFPEYETSALRSDLTPGGPFREAAKEVRRIKDGPATMLGHAEPETPAIAIYYSSLNFHASSISGAVGDHVNNFGAHEVQWSVCPAERMKGRPEAFTRMWTALTPAGHYAPAFKSFATLVKDLNLDFSVIDRSELNTGKLSKFKILILPFAEVLSDTDAKAVKGFVQNGGCVIADYRTGIRDEHCNFRTSGALDELFGIKTAYPFTAGYRRENVVISSFMGDWITSFTMPVSFTQRDITVTSGNVLGASDSGVPVFIENKRGRGRALYCNFDFYNYFELRKEKRENAVREYFRKFLVRYFDLPAFDVVRDMAHNPAPSSSVFRFNDGKISYAGVLIENIDGEKTVRIPMVQSGFMYDVLNRKALGFGRIAEVSAAPGTPVFIASMPYEIVAPVLTGNSIGRVGETYRLNISAGSAAHTVKVCVYDQEGRELKHYGKVLYLKDGQGCFELPLALNDRPGNWKISVEEAVSGRASSWKFRLK